MNETTVSSAKYHKPGQNVKYNVPTFSGEVVPVAIPMVYPWRNA